MRNPTPPNAEAKWWIASVVAVAAGCGLRVLTYLRTRPLWVDEAMLANNVLGRSWTELLRPLGANQAAPPGFLLLVKGCVTLFGSSETSLRLVPFLSGLATLPLVWLLARRTIGPAGACIATLFVALHPPLVYYGSELKQYAVDACLAIVVPLVWLPLFPAREEQSPRVAPRSQYAVCLVVCVFAPWLSHAATFVVAGCCAAALTASGGHRDRNDVRLAMSAAAAFVGSFAVEYVFFLRPQADNAYLKSYWQSGFVPWNTGVWGVISWIGGTYTAVVDYPLFQASGLLVLIVGLVGTTSLWRVNRSLVLILVWTLVAALTAAAMHAYPLRDRLLLWIVPLAMVVLAAGIAAPWREQHDEKGEPSRVRRTSLSARLLAAGLGAVLLAPMVQSTFEAVVRPDRKEDLPAVLDYVRRTSKPGDTIYVYPGAVPAFRYYFDNRGIGGLPDAKIIEGRSQRGDVASWVADVERLEGRTWFVFSHVWNDPRTGRSEDDLLVEVLGDRARPLDVHEPAPEQIGFDRALVLLYDLPPVESP